MRQAKAADPQDVVAGLPAIVASQQK